MARIWFLIAGLSGFLAVALSAYGFHSLRTDMTDDQFLNFQLASILHLVHSLGLMGVGLLCLHAIRFASLAGGLFIAGLVLFCGTIYANSVTDVPGIAMLPPFGGLSFMIGWILIGVGGFFSVTDR